jgi:hypothetical protein
MSLKISILREIAGEKKPNPNNEAGRFTYVGHVALFTPDTDTSPRLRSLAR